LSASSAPCQQLVLTRHQYKTHGCGKGVAQREPVCSRLHQACLKVQATVIHPKATYLTSGQTLGYDTGQARHRTKQAVQLLKERALSTRSCMESSSRDATSRLDARPAQNVLHQPSTCACPAGMPKAQGSKGTAAGPPGTLPASLQTFLCSQ